MKLLIISLLLSCFSSFAFSQNEHINCTIFVDGKLPGGSWIYDEYFSYSDSTNSVVKIEFNYVTGEIQLSVDNANLIHTLRPENEITIHFTYKKYKGEIYTYSGNLRVAWLSNQYLVIRITNLNKKKGEYYFAYSTPGISKPFIKKEYNMFEEY